MSNSTTEEVSTEPHHHIHRDNEPLPGATGAAPTFDYSPETIDHTTLPSVPEGGQHDLTSSHHCAHKLHKHIPASDRHAPIAVQPGQEGAHRNERELPNPHMDVNSQEAPTQSLVGQGGIPGDERPGERHGTTTNHPTSHKQGHEKNPEKKSTVGDKIVGKTEEITGKLTHNIGLEEKGVLRAQGKKN